MPDTQLFISFANPDKEVATGLSRLVETLFVVPENALRCTSRLDTGIELADSIQNQITRHLETAKVFILVLTADAIKSDWVRFELAFAKLRNKVILPVVTDPSKIPHVPEVEDMLYIDLSRHPEVHKMIAKLEQVLHWSKKGDKDRMVIHQAVDEITKLARKKSIAFDTREPPEISALGKTEVDLFENLVRNIADGKCTPFIGALARTPLLPTAKELAEKLTYDPKYPFKDCNDLGRITKYIDTVKKDRGYSRNKIVELLSDNGKFPSEAQNADLLFALARLPFKLYVTTNYDNLMYMELEKANRHPRRVVPAWRKALASFHTDYMPFEKFDDSSSDENTFSTEKKLEPSTEAPILFHLNGYIGEPNSMVVTEDDQLDFLMAMTSERIKGKNSREPNLVIPQYVEYALSRNALMLIGYRLYDWSFRVITRLTKMNVQNARDFQHPALQTVLQLPSEDNTNAKKYIEEYFRNLNFEVSWGSATSFAQKLNQFWKNPKKP